ncbi:hypothetical protein L202_05102 [Cryptococcus amylolentus CBS 6039]|uniref:Uncharacterized protein n=2 Tax=Cryptococcus amylolentus TaxID=104669 RepID=A0A1E3HNV3_9TREE|nr:hypothetical protein L202_05102 [Cryptococcus amylolentus CBS 6039]ODN78017.1 hypothetical protein L202_05102 [Cryptococcus amylolentus CBS 6039]ODO05965.1 hypothetical protein I350_05026 [Cryptococcus amylolentus CBS 6273]
MSHIVILDNMTDHSSVASRPTPIKGKLATVLDEMQYLETQQKSPSPTTGSGSWSRSKFMARFFPILVSRHTLSAPGVEAPAHSSPVPPHTREAIDDRSVRRSSNAMPQSDNDPDWWVLY